VPRTEDGAEIQGSDKIDVRVKDTAGRLGVNTRSVCRGLRRRLMPRGLCGTAARRFRYEALSGSIGVAAPMAFFPFGGWKESFFGDLHGQGLDAADFFTQKKVDIERWPKEWTRKF